MSIHVLPGDSIVNEFKESGLDGEMIVCRECLNSGPIDAETLEEFWDQRARFILTDFGEDEIEYHERVADQLAKLTEPGNDREVNLWFEYELFCSVNMWFCLSLLSQTDAQVYRVEPIGLGDDDRWNGFGKFTADDLKASYALRTRLSKEDVDLGAALWDAYSHKNYDELLKLAENASPSAFPYLREVVRAAADEDIEPLEALRQIVASGKKDFGEIFTEFRERAGVYGYGDLQVSRLLDQLSS